MAMTKRKLETIDEIIVHIFASKWGTEKDCNKWHRDRGWPDTGYHFVILNEFPQPDLLVPFLDGQITPARPLEFMGAHCRGHNKTSIGIALVGDKIVTQAQFQALRRLCDGLETLLDKKLK